MNNSLVGLMAGLIPLPRCHFLMAGYTPLSPPPVGPAAGARYLYSQTSHLGCMMLSTPNLEAYCWTDRA